MEQSGSIRVKGACDPALAALDEVCARFDFAERGVRAFADFEEMLDSGRAGEGTLPWVSVAAPIPVHAAMHRGCLERGLGCYLEKPPTLAPRELEEMIARDLRAPFRSQVGFNYIAQEERLALKRRLLGGEFGRLQRVTFMGAWKRSQRYFTRSAWTGRLLLRDKPLMDSCLGNGMSHHTHNLLFFAGPGDLYSWASCTGLEAEFYRVNEIEGPDTIFVKGTLEGGIDLRLALTNACAGKDLSVETLECEHASIYIWPHEAIEIRWKNGQVERVPLPGHIPLRNNLEAFLGYLKGEVARPSTLLEDCRPIVNLNALAFAACGRIHVIPDTYVSRTEATVPIDQCLAIEGIIGHLRRLVEEGTFPSQTDCPWGQAGGVAQVGDLQDLTNRLVELRNRAVPQPVV